MDWQQKLKELTFLSWLAIALLIANIIGVPLFFMQNDKLSYVDSSYPTLLTLNIASTANSPVLAVIENAEQRVKSISASGEVAGAHEGFQIAQSSNKNQQVESSVDAITNTSSGHETLDITVTSVIAQCYQISLFSSPKEQMEVERLLVMFEFEVSQIIKGNLKNKPDSLGYWVFSPPLASRVLGRLKVEEFKLKGFRNAVLLINDQPLYAISLGFFQNERQAHMKLMKAQSLGFNVKMDIRSKERSLSMLLVSRHPKLKAESIDSVLKDYNELKIQPIDCR